VLQDIYLNVWRKAGAFGETRASPITWLVAIARNCAIDRLRSGRMLRLSEPVEAASEIPDDAPLAAEALETAFRAVGRGASAGHAAGTVLLPS
jgi:DNA-directed RNA polymerase specialized sigma24 family protein